ncbi:MAG: carboxymuconolactone decarboxylase family protein [Candidatus Eisenbacteria bacterium]|nr:carboxymuconolactone decarboxylase family protein [Candidatus Eisenbacteria bacterium]
MTNKVEEFRRRREAGNEAALENGTLLTKRFFNLDSRCYEARALDRKTKELLGLAASLVLRCDDCITYHLTRAVEEGATRKELAEVLDVALVVGGSITIPHLRRAHEVVAELIPSG